MAPTHLDVRLLNVARSEIEDIIESRTSLITSGLLEFPEYRFRSGELVGLKLALQIMQDIVRDMGDGKL